MRTASSWQRRVLAAADNGAPLTVLHAPGGSGKTSILRAWAAELQAAGRPVLWASLSPRDCTTNDAWDAVVSAATGGGLSTTASGEAASAWTHQDRVDATHLIAGEIPGLTLFVDHCEHVTRDPAALWRTIQVAAALHRGNRLVAATRWLPEASLTALALDPAVHLVDASVLTARPEEVAEILTGSDEPLAEAFIASAVAHAAHDLRLLNSATLDPTRVLGHGPEADVPDWETLRAAQAERDIDTRELTDVVRSLAWLPLLDPELAALVLDRELEDAVLFLDHLEHLGLCVRGHDVHDRPTLTWAPHARATRIVVDGQQNPHVTPETGAAVVDRLSQLSAHSEALAVALRLGLLDRASTLHRRLFVLHQESLDAEVQDAFAQAPHDLLVHHPLLAVGRVLPLLDDPSTRLAAGPFLEPLLARDPRDITCDTADDEIIELTAQTMVLTTLGQHEAANRAALEAARRLEDPAFMLRTTAVIAQVSGRLGMALVEAGHVGEAQDLAARALALTDADRRRDCTRASRLWYALDGRTVQAHALERHFSHEVGSPNGDDAGAVHLATIGEALLLLDDLDLDAASRLVGDDDVALSESNATWAGWVRALLSLHDGTRLAMATALTGALETSAAAGTLGGAHEATTLALGWLHAGQVARARSVLRLGDQYPAVQSPAVFQLDVLTSGAASALTRAGALFDLPGHTVRSRSALHLFVAAAASAAGAEGTAQAHLAQAGALHAQHGARAHLLMLAPDDLHALRSVARSTATPEVRELFAGTELLHTDAVEAAAPVLLTERELAVLRQLVHQPSRRAIADRLHVSENTVKSQLRSLYRKLDATDRPAAIARAVDLDLLPPESLDGSSTPNP